MLWKGWVERWRGIYKRDFSNATKQSFCKMVSSNLLQNKIKTMTIFLYFPIRSIFNQFQHFESLVGGLVTPQDDNIMNQSVTPQFAHSPSAPPSPEQTNKFQRILTNTAKWESQENVNDFLCVKQSAFRNKCKLIHFQLVN